MWLLHDVVLWAAGRIGILRLAGKFLGHTRKLSEALGKAHVWKLRKFAAVLLFAIKKLFVYVFQNAPYSVGVVFGELLVSNSLFGRHLKPYVICRPLGVRQTLHLDKGKAVKRMDFDPASFVVRRKHESQVVVMKAVRPTCRQQTSTGVLVTVGAIPRWRNTSFTQYLELLLASLTPSTNRHFVFFGTRFFWYAGISSQKKKFGQISRSFQSSSPSSLMSSPSLPSELVDSVRLSE